MINKFFRWYRTNKVIFWRNILIVIGVLALIFILSNTLENTPNQNSYKYNLSNPSTVKSTKSAVTSEKVIQEKLETANTIIDKFITYLNEGNYELAYELLSIQCKEQLYPTVQKFKEEYYDKIFKTYKSYNMQNWLMNTYKIEYRESLLDTGGIETSGFIRDYITVVEENSSYKLNINDFIGLEKIGKKANNNDIDIEVISKSVYMSYEIYNISIENRTSKDIKIADLSLANSIYVVDNNNVKYYAYLNELTEAQITVPRGTKANVSIKFMKQYSSNNETVNIVLKNVLLNMQKSDITSIMLDI